MSIDIGYHPRKWRCSKGHEWESTEFEICSFKINDSPTICAKCIKEFIVQNFGVVEEIGPQPEVPFDPPVYGTIVEDDGA